MAKTPDFKVYDASGVYQASVKEPEAGAALLSGLYPGGTIRLGHSKKFIVYTDEIDGDAGNSFDEVADVVWERLQNWA